MKRYHLHILLTLLIFISSCQPKDSILELPSIISNNMVLQQQSETAIWGTARPTSKIKIEGSWGSTESTKTMEDSTWMIQLKTIEAGGPYTITIKNDDSINIIYNVLLGEVWLCSGQSNMEMPVSGWPPNDTIQGSKKAIADSENSQIRMFTVANRFAPTPQMQCSGSWLEGNPKNTPSFSATAYFFGRRLHEKLNVPIGLIHSSWGGTPVESWMSNRKLKDDSDFEAIAEKVASSKDEMTIYENWLINHPTMNMNWENGNDPLIDIDLFDSICSSPDLNDNNWNTMQIPNYIETTDIGDFDGVIWFRKEIEIAKDWENKTLTLNLGPIDDRDLTYFNGVLVGGYKEAGYWQENRKYKIPARLVKEGKAVIAIRVIDNTGGGGMYGNESDLHISLNKTKKTSLSGNWKYKLAAEIKDTTLYLFDPTTNYTQTRPHTSFSLNQYTATTLYNGMIAPILPYTIKGTIWYQGEANIGRSNQYSRIFPKMIENWREDFHNPQMPFYYVQLAPWEYSGYNYIELGNLRDAQRRTLSIKNTGMAVTLDIGNFANIHPCNKIDVGERLARWALGKTYNKDIVISGPLYKNISIVGNRIKVTFDYTNGGLKVTDTTNNYFEIAGADSIFSPAKIQIKYDVIWVESSKIKNPKFVRYAYCNGHEATLFNEEGLPASSFSTMDILID